MNGDQFKLIVTPAMTAAVKNMVDAFYARRQMINNPEFDDRQRADARDTYNASKKILLAATYAANTTIDIEAKPAEDPNEYKIERGGRAPSDNIRLKQWGRDARAALTQLNTLLHECAANHEHRILSLTPNLTQQDLGITSTHPRPQFRL